MEFERTKGLRSRSRKTAFGVQKRETWVLTRSLLPRTSAAAIQVESKRDATWRGEPMHANSYPQPQACRRRGAEDPEDPTGGLPVGARKAL